jgi:hypothetical protein
MRLLSLSSVLFSNTYPPADKTDKTDETLDDDNGTMSVSTQPSPAFLTATGHTLLRAIATGHSGPLQAAAGALDTGRPAARGYSRSQAGCGVDVTDHRAAIADSAHRSERCCRSTTSTRWASKAGS